MARISVGRAELENRPHILYRFYDRTGVLLYVGITVDFADRMATHAKEKDWWVRVDRSATQVDYYDSRRAALDAEREAIKAEKPLENDQHNVFMEASAATLGSQSPCGDRCTTACRSHHEDKWWQGRDDLAVMVIDEVRGVLGEDQRLLDAAKFAAAHLELPVPERTYPDDNAVVLTALSLVERVADDTARLRLIARYVFDAVPAGMLAAATEAAERDWSCAGEPEAPWEDKMVDVLRHLSYLLAKSFNQPRPGRSRKQVQV
ncbi:hypothetical protein ACWT_5697 [Actinoplanes sp. SE50]|uniref:GIY-YIG nuclease family protein n=1 Tax=unclassified Actinoplanes TaxID=2626549 RepID=UPI00023ED2E0|nr:MULTISPECIES: GIY-YIG nuclease family protein [unclassified Actinoplanes]AEV86714.1 hypothetical protein ACPL_5827 [Actinoplanes sp. SE50/110]ATO85112.1 hypothetical protein ACWT_5697 [Actinoplanes sp. SE50]SLM02523.1 GIY-YIG catalytic domain protein [Actinoplanes sp. SE50/110]